ncbi:type IV pilin [Halomicrococcus sp. NG-SE-24]|uniref:type IV pilin n=1 Tax=Halomicrococcus sp. NG-SE-24 TaxID=3436928 RepID=UPI003D97DB4E
MTLKEKFEAITGRDFDRAVSPVIGVILMVAITVILAAVIGTFVMGMGSNVESNVNAGASISVNNSSDGGSVDVTWVSKGSASKLNVTVKKNGAAESDVLKNVGESVKINETQGSFSSDTTANNVKVIVTAVGEDGKKKTVINNEEHTI